MEPEFWKQRWESGQIAFHRPEASPELVRHERRISSVPGARVLVPLAGKSLDVAYLAERGLSPIAVELVEDAVRQFFAEAGLEPRVESDGALLRFEADEITYYAGDFFELSLAQAHGVNAVFDRAALIALPPGMRERYVAHLKSLLSRPATILLVTMEYPEASGFQGPPFSVSKSDVLALYDGARVEELDAREVPTKSPRARALGLESTLDRVYEIVLD